MAFNKLTLKINDLLFDNSDFTKMNNFRCISSMKDKKFDRIKLMPIPESAFGFTFDINNDRLSVPRETIRRVRDNMYNEVLNVLTHEIDLKLQEELYNKAQEVKNIVFYDNDDEYNMNQVHNILKFADDIDGEPVLIFNKVLNNMLFKFFTFERENNQKYLENIPVFFNPYLKDDESYLLSSLEIEYPDDNLITVEDDGFIYANFNIYKGKIYKF